MWAAQDGNDRGARPCDRLAHAAVFPLLGSGFDSKRVFCYLDAQNELTFTG
jgi:hypothetical protein